MGEPNWFWCDLETTGFDPQNDSILEVAVVVTTPQLVELYSCQTLLEVNVDAAYARADDYVRNMHAQNGLWDDLRNPASSRIPPNALATWLGLIADSTGCSKGPEQEGSPLCGSTPSFDRGFLAVQAPGFLSRLSHRHVDTSTVHLCCKAWFDSHHEGDGQTAHRALADIRFSIDRLLWYRARHFNPHGRRSIAAAMKDELAVLNDG